MATSHEGGLPARREGYAARMRDLSAIMRGFGPAPTMGPVDTGRTNFVTLAPPQAQFGSPDTFPARAIYDYLHGQDFRVYNLLADLWCNSMSASYIPGDAFRFPKKPIGLNDDLSARQRALREELAPHVARGALSAQYPLYGASGYDASTVASVFPEASASIMINNENAVPCMPSRQELSAKMFNVKERAFTVDYGNVIAKGGVPHMAAQQGSLLTAILANLKVVYPDLNLCGVMIFCGVPVLPYRAATKFTVRSHAAIFYRPSLEENLRALIYINAAINDGRSHIEIDAPEGKTVGLDLSFIDALLVKGSQGILCPLKTIGIDRAFDRQSDTKRIRENKIRETLLLDVQQNGGVIVEGVHAHPQYSEYAYPSPSWECFPDELFDSREVGEASVSELRAAWQQVHQSDTKLSYSKGTRVWRARQRNQAMRDGVRTNFLFGAAGLFIGPLADMFNRPLVTRTPRRGVALQRNESVYAALPRGADRSFVD